MTKTIGMSKDTFVKLKDTDAKLEALFEVLTEFVVVNLDQDEKCSGRVKECNEHFAKIEKRKAMDTTVSGVMGLIGGMLVWFVKWVVGR